MSIRRRVFADDAGRSIAFINLRRKRFDIALMNPPFGAASMTAKKEFKSAYPRTKDDMCATFVKRGIELPRPTDYLGAIASRMGFFPSRFQKWREEIPLKKVPPSYSPTSGGTFSTARWSRSRPTACVRRPPHDH